MTKNENILIIGVAGGTGSGKTTLAAHIAKVFGNRVAVITHDSYYRAQNDKTYEERCLQNYDHPDAFETELLCEHLEQLCRGHAVDVPVYDYTVHNRSDRTQRVEPRAVIVLEGILLLSDERLRGMMDLKIFVDTDADVRLCRRIKRDVEKRGRSLDSVLTQYQDTVKPMHERYVEPSKKYANLVVPEGGKNLVALDMIVGRIQRHLDEVEKV